MRAGLEFFLGTLERDDAACVAWEDLTGRHGKSLLVLQQMGFIAAEPGMNPVPSCPFCTEGSPYRLGERYLCNGCFSTVDQRYLLLWPLHLDAFLHWLSTQLKLQGDVRSIDGHLWQLGSRAVSGTRIEVFYRHGALNQAEKGRLAVFKNTLVLYGLTRPPDGDQAAQSLSLLELLDWGTALTVAELSSLLDTRGTVTFDPSNGALHVGTTRLGEVPAGSKEFFFLQCLAKQLDTFVPYADIKRSVMQSTGSGDETEEATFCQLLKSRIKKRWIPDLDRLIVTSNKAEGYRMRGSR